MTAILVGDFEANSPEWHAARAQGIGASEIAAVVGLSPFESPFSLWHRKKGTLPGPDPSNPLFYWGHKLEPLVAEKFAELHDEFEVVETGTYRSTDRPWQLANLDRALVDRYPQEMVSLLEIKTTRYGDNWGQSGTDDIPVHVRCQVMQQMDVFSAPYAWVAVLIGGSEYREYRIDFDETDAAVLREAGAAFWESLQTDDEPPVDASWETFEAVKALHPDIDGSDVEIDPEAYTEYLTTKQMADHWTSKHREAKSALLHQMADARRALYFGKPVLRRQPGRNGSVSLYPIQEKSA